MKIDVRDRGWFLFIIILLSSNKLRDQNIVWFKPYLSRTCINPRVCFFIYIVKSIVIRLKHNSREYNFIVAYVGSTGNNAFYFPCAIDTTAVCVRNLLCFIFFKLNICGDFCT